MYICERERERLYAALYVARCATDKSASEPDGSRRVPFFGAGVLHFSRSRQASSLVVFFFFSRTSASGVFEFLILNIGEGRATFVEVVC